MNFPYLCLKAIQSGPLCVNILVANTDIVDQTKPESTVFHSLFGANVSHGAGGQYGKKYNAQHCQRHLIFRLRNCGSLLLLFYVTDGRVKLRIDTL